MSRFRRIGLAATAAAAVLALAIVPSASAITTHTGPSGSGTFSVTSIGNIAAATFYVIGNPSTGGSTTVGCVHGNNGNPIQYGWGVADGQERTLLFPPFQERSPTVGGGCSFVDADGSASAVEVSAASPMALTLTGLAPGQNPSSPRRKYNGRLSLYPYGSSLSFRPAKYPDCSVSIRGTQSADILGGGIVVDDDQDRIDLDATGVTFAMSKTAACPSTIGNSMSIIQTYGSPYGSGWRLNNVTVTP
ncbi:MAG: hypothetical protein WC558_04300 [Patulibacter sp.]